MRTMAEVTQLYNEGMWMNIKNKEYCHLGVTINQYKQIVILFMRGHELFFMTFRDEECLKEFIDENKLLEIVYDSRGKNGG